MNITDINELHKYYNQRQTDYEEYLRAKLNDFKSAQGKYLSEVIAGACEQAKAALENSNRTAFIRFYDIIVDLELKTKQNYPVSLLNRLAQSARKTFDDSLKFNQSIFEQSIVYYKDLLNK